MEKWLEELVEIVPAEASVANGELKSITDVSHASHLLKDREEVTAQTSPHGDTYLPSEEELTEIAEHFEERGYVLLCSTVLRDKVAYVRGEVEKPKVPDGFVTYTEHELCQLFGSDAPPIEQSLLRLIHEAKKRGGVVTAREWALNLEGKGEEPDELG